MNELIARALVARFATLQTDGLLTTVAGLVKSMETDTFSKGKKQESVPVEYTQFTREAHDWKLLLPDPDKNAVLYIEDGGYSEKQMQGLWQIKSRLMMVSWFNGSRVIDISRERMTNILLNNMLGAGRNIPSSEPGLTQLKLEGWNNTNSDPFTKYSAYQNLFAFRNAPYGWLALDLSLTAYVNPGCLIQ